MANILEKLKNTLILSTALAISGCVLPNYSELRTDVDDLATVEEIQYPANLGVTNVDSVPIIHLRGNSYERGYQYGEEFAQRLDNIYDFRDSAMSWLAFKEIPPLILFGGNFFLPDLHFRSVYRDADEFIPEEFKAKLQGIADGAEISLSTIQRTVAAEMTFDSSCSGFVAWGNATKNKTLIQTRNLDLGLDELLLRENPIIEVHHPEQGNQYLAIGILGLPGVITGINEKGISLTEIGAGSFDKTYAGTPMPAMLEQVLLHSNNLVDAVRIIQETPGTGGYVYLIGSGEENLAVRIDKTASLTVVYSDQKQVNLADEKLIEGLDLDVPYAYLIDNIVVGSDPALDSRVRMLQHAAGGELNTMKFPSRKSYKIRYLLQAQLLDQFKGNIDVEIAKKINLEITPNSNLHSVIYDFSAKKVYFANAASIKQKKSRASEQAYLELDLKKLFD